MRKEEAKDVPNVVMGTFSLLTQLIDVLFDSGATHSFISARLVATLGLTPTHKSLLLSVTLPDGQTVSCEELHEGVAPLECMNVNSWRTYISLS